MNTEKQTLAHDLYMHTDKTQQEIAAIVGVHRQTIRFWIRQNHWNELKVAARQMPAIIQQNIYNYITALNDKISHRSEDDRCPTMQEVNMLQKLLNMAGSIKKQHTGAYLEAFQELQLFIYNRDTALAMQLRDHIAAYAHGTIGDKEFMARKKRKDNVLEVTAALGREELREQESSNNDTFCSPGGEGMAAPQSIPADAAPRQQVAHPVAEMAQQCSVNDTFCTTEESPEPQAPAHPNASTVAVLGHIDAPQPPAEMDDDDLPEQTVCFTNDGQMVDANKVFQKAMTLPPHMRPSPFVVGNTVFILHPDHLESRLDTYGNPWGPMKMSYTIRYYPDIDPAKAA